MNTRIELHTMADMVGICDSHPAHCGTCVRHLCIGEPGCVRRKGSGPTDLLQCAACHFSLKDEDESRECVVCSGLFHSLCQPETDIDRDEWPFKDSGEYMCSFCLENHLTCGVCGVVHNISTGEAEGGDMMSLSEWMCGGCVVIRATAF